MQSATVILVEDDGSMCLAIERLLEAGGFACRAYASAEDLLAHGVAGDAACLVSDLRLPGMSGLQLLQVLRDRGGWPPRVLITANDAPGMREAAARHGAVAYLVKPFEGAALLKVVKAAIDLEARP